MTRTTSPQRLKPQLFFLLTDGLKAVPFTIEPSISKCSMGFVANSAKGIVGLRPPFRPGYA
jgi:hypothetical protein